MNKLIFAIIFIVLISFTFAAKDRAINFDIDDDANNQGGGHHGSQGKHFNPKIAGFKSYDAAACKRSSTTPATDTAAEGAEAN